MRRRLLLLVFTTTLFALTLLGVILMAVIWAATDSAAVERAEANARVDAAALGRILEVGGTVDQQIVDELVRDQATLLVRLAGRHHVHRRRTGAAATPTSARPRTPA